MRENTPAHREEHVKEHVCMFDRKRREEEGEEGQSHGGPERAGPLSPLLTVWIASRKQIPLAKQ